jgi:hypothetical protein
LEKVNHFNISRDTTLRFVTKASELDMYHYENPETHDVIQKANMTYTETGAFVFAVLYDRRWIRIVSSMAITLTFSVRLSACVADHVPSLIANLLGEGRNLGRDATDRRRFCNG